MTHNPSYHSIEPWQLTAYTLNELEPSDAAKVEQALESDAGLRIELEQIQQTLTAVRSALASSTVSVTLSENQTATLTSQIKQVVAPNGSSANVAAATVKLAERPFYRRKRFAALLATAAAIPLAVTWMPAMFQAGGPFAMTVPGQTLPSSYYLNDDVQYFPNSSTSKASSNPVTESSQPASIVASKDAIGSGSELVGDVDLSFVPEMGLVIVKGNKEEVEKTKKFMESLKENEQQLSRFAESEPINYPTAEVWGELAARKVDRYGAIELQDQAGRGEVGGVVQTTVSVPDGGTILLGGIKRERERLKLSVGEQTQRVTSTLMIPEELRANAPHLFRVPTSERSGADRFEKIVETPFLETQKAPLSTFSIDVDSASYSKIRQTLLEGNRLPSPSMVRIEEMVNYFEYGYAGPVNEQPFAAHMSIDRCPWNTEHQLVRVGLQAKKLESDKRVKANIVFLLDVSGSMNEPNKLPLVKKALSMMVNQLTENDRVAIVVYAGAAGCVLPSICGAEKQTILSSLDHLNAGGSTNGGQGIQLAYSIAKEHFIPGGANRVVLCTDGDFNVGVTGDDALVAMMQENAKSNIFLTCLGFGAGNYNDSMMEKISNRGNGIYGMIDNELEARRMMVEQLSGTLVTVAKDVKIQVDFNPAKVAGYRLIGYEDRRLANKDFANDQKDAGEIGAGHRVTALYEVIPTGKWVGIAPSDSESSKYLQKPKTDSQFETPAAGEFSAEVLTLKVRYKEPEGSVSTLQEFVLKDSERDDKPLVDRDMQWASSVAEFGLLLRHSEMAPQADWTEMLERASSSAGSDAYRLECLAMMRKAKSMTK